jgi:hypothetical protein
MVARNQNRLEFVEGGFCKKNKFFCRRLTLLTSTGYNLITKREGYPKWVPFFFLLRFQSNLYNQNRLLIVSGRFWDSAKQSVISAKQFAIP